jgi:hypothetical protein
MLSGKYWRTISRGVLGNGLRVLCAAVALCDGTIMVETRGRRTVLRPQRFATTCVVEQTSSDVTEGTRITYTLGGAIPHDASDTDLEDADDSNGGGDDLADADRAITVARLALPPYARRPSPHWLDLDHLVKIFQAIEPADTTVRQLIEQLDGCTGATAGKLAAPFGKGRTCRSMTETEIGDLLRALQTTARKVQPKGLGPIGAEAFGDPFDANFVAEAQLRIGRRAPYAVCPVLIEA